MQEKKNSTAVPTNFDTTLPTMKVYLLEHYGRMPPKSRYHHAPKKILERFENMEKYAVYYRILHPGSKDPYDLGAIPEESCQDGVVKPDWQAFAYPSLVGLMWKENFSQVTCPHCNTTPCPSRCLVESWFEKVKMSDQRREYRHPGYKKGETLKRDPHYLTTWFRQKYCDYVLRNYRNNMKSPDGVEHRCLCIEEELACQFPERCSACGFKPCLVHQAGKMIYNYLQGEWGGKHDVVKFREMMACFKREWQIRRGLRDEGHAKENGAAYRPAWMSDDLFSHGHGPDCVDKYARLLFPKAASSRDFQGMYPGSDERVMGWSPDEGHLYDLEASKVAHANWLLWCEDADPDDWDTGSTDDHSYSYRMDQAFHSEIFSDSDSSVDSHYESTWARRARRVKNIRRLQQNDRVLKRKVRDFSSDNTSSSAESSVEGGPPPPPRRFLSPRGMMRGRHLARSLRVPVPAPRAGVPVVVEVPL